MDVREQNTTLDYAVYRQVVGDLMNSNEQLPSLPTIIFDIRKALAQPNLSMLELSNLLAKDPALAAVLMKYASSPLIGSQSPPQTLLDVIRLLGMNQVERITMVHSIKSLFAGYSARHRRLYMEAWRRLALKASLSTYIAKHIKQILPDHVLMAALMSDVGTLAVLSAFNKTDAAPDIPTFIALCREYAKSLGAITLKKWQVDDQYLTVVRDIGHWQEPSPGPINLSDVINLGLFHSLKLSHTGKNLPPLEALTAYQKLEEPNNKIIVGGLEVVMTNVVEIRVLARSLF